MTNDQATPGSPQNLEIKQILLRLSEQIEEFINSDRLAENNVKDVKSFDPILTSVEWFLAGAAASGVLSYFLDPERGQQRRTRVKLKLDYYRRRGSLWASGKLNKKNLPLTQWTSETLPKKSLVAMEWPAKVWGDEDAESLP